MSELELRLKRAEETIQRQAAYITALEADLMGASRTNNMLQRELAWARKELRQERQRQAANDRPAPNPVGNVVVLRDFDPADPRVSLRKAGGRR